MVGVCLERINTRFFKKKNGPLEKSRVYVKEQTYLLTGTEVLALWYKSRILTARKKSLVLLKEQTYLLTGTEVLALCGTKVEY